MAGAGAVVRARGVADRYGTVHEELTIDEDVAATLPRLSAAYDEPLGDEAAFPTFLIAEQARRHVTVALTGDGGDEAFAGYERYIAHDLASRVPAPLARAGAARAALDAFSHRAFPRRRRRIRRPALRAPHGSVSARAETGALDRPRPCAPPSSGATSAGHGRAAAPRHRHLSAGRPAAEGRHRLHGAFA